MRKLWKNIKDGEDGDELFRYLNKMEVFPKRLERLNKGYNFFNLEPSNRKYYIEVMLKINLNLREKQEEIRIRSNLPFERDYYSELFNLSDFLNSLKEWAEKPYYIPKNFNRKNKLGSYELKTDGFRQEKVNFADINIEIGELAERYLIEKHKMDFKRVVEEIINLQKDAKKEESKAIDRWIYLKEKILSLENFKKKEEYSYSYNRDDDKTKKILMTAEQYNKELKKIEEEMLKLSKFKFLEIRKNDFKYETITKKVSYKEWVKELEEELKREYEQYDDRESFEEFCKIAYENCNGEVEVIK